MYVRTYVVNSTYAVATLAGTDRLDKELTIGQMQGECCRGCAWLAVK